MSMVLDASATISWFFADEHSEAAHAVLRRVAAEGATVPSLWRLEVANVFRGAVRRLRCDQAYADESLRRLSRFAITVDPETDGRAWGETRALSLEEDLTLYDASYLELALRTNAPLASRDMDLVAAARRRRVEVIEA